MYDFDTVINRRNSGSLKWDVPERELPMWVADMDFRIAPEIEEALQTRLAHGVFGYSILPDEWAKSYVNWWEKRHHFKMEEDWLVFCTGVIPALSTAVRKLTTPAEKVVVQTPVYNMFFNSIVNNGRQILENPLLYEDGKYMINWEDLEAKLADPQTSLMILCNPHNPIGKIWDRDTLARIGELCEKYAVTVISDEIHCDITDPGTEYVPFASVSETCARISVTCIAPTKCFNMAGIQSAAVAVPNPVLRHKMWRGLNTDEVAEPNAFAVTATVAAFERGEQWVKEMCSYVAGNKEYVRDFIKREVPGIHVVDSEATYLLWLDCSAISQDADELAARIREKTGLYMTAGSHYGENGKCFIRLNVACPKTLVEDGMKRLKIGVEGI